MTFLEERSRDLFRHVSRFVTQATRGRTSLPRRTSLNIDDEGSFPHPTDDLLPTIILDTLDGLIADCLQRDCSARASSQVRRKVFRRESHRMHSDRQRRNARMFRAFKVTRGVTLWCERSNIRLDLSPQNPGSRR